MAEITIRVPGIPAPKGSVSGFPVQRKGGRTGVVITHGTKSKHWETLVRDQMPEESTLAGALSMTVWFYLPRPASVTRKYPEVRPDLDKLVRATNDALQHGLFKDDAQIVDADSHKRYGDEGFIGAVITVEEMDES